MSFLADFIAAQQREAAAVGAAAERIAEQVTAVAGPLPCLTAAGAPDPQEPFDVLDDVQQHIFAATAR